MKTAGGFRVRVTPNARRNRVQKDKSGLKVYLTAPPVEGKANRLLLELLADYFHCRKAQIKIVRGSKSRDKTILIENRKSTCNR